MAQSKRAFVVDEKGRKKWVQLPIKEYESLLEDLADLAIIAERRAEPSEPLDALKGRLVEKWLNTESK